MKIKISSIQAREILDSRGNPTIMTTVTLSNGIKGTAAVPSGASTGVHEALELRDKDAYRYHGKGVLDAIENIHGTITKQLKGMTFSSLEDIDYAMIELDGTENKSLLGANAILSVSMATARALAREQDVELYTYLRRLFFNTLNDWKLPQCMINIVNGGEHAGWATDFQEYMIIPQQQSTREQIRCASEVFQSLRKNLHSKLFPITVGDEGGFALKLSDNKKPFEFIMKAIKSAGYRATQDVKLSLDVAASEFYKKGRYHLNSSELKMDSGYMISMYRTLIGKYPLISIEDGLAEDDWVGWKKMTAELGDKIQIVGDDLFVTNIKRLQRGIKEKSANSILVKLNQIGTVTETAKTIHLARENGFSIVISHRSGETLDTFISDLAVASGAEYLKAGSVCRGERIAKYNRLMEIESHKL